MSKPADWFEEMRAQQSLAESYRRDMMRLADKFEKLEIVAKTLAENLGVALILAEKDLLSYERQKQYWRDAIDEFNKLHYSYSRHEENK